MKSRRERLAGGLAVYVTSHGFGHLNRTAAVLNRVPADVPVTIRSNSNLFEHWRERLKRPAELEHYVCRCRGGQSARRQCRHGPGGDARAGHAISRRGDGRYR